MPPTHSPRLAVLALVVAVAPARADDPAPTPGTVRTLSVVSVSLAAGSTERETKRVVYAPPPGWYIRSHKVECPHKDGLSSFTVSTVPAGWSWKLEENSSETAKQKGLATVSLPHGWVGGRAEGESDHAAAGRQANTSTHHVLVVDVTAKGAGLWRGPGTIELTVQAEMVYVGK